MWILRKDSVLHSFDEWPTEDDITDGYVDVVYKDGNHRRFLYTVNGGWNTCFPGDENFIPAEEMKELYMGWASYGQYRIVSAEDSWLNNHKDIVEGVRLKLSEKPDKLTEEEEEKWDRIDEYFTLMLTALDFVEGINE